MYTMVLLNARRPVAGFAALMVSVAIVAGCGAHRSTAPPGAAGSLMTPVTGSPHSTATSRTNAGGMASGGPSGTSVARATAGSPGSPGSAGFDAPTGSTTHTGVDYNTLAGALSAHGVHLVKPTQITLTPALRVGPYVSSYAMRTAQLTTGSVWFGAWNDHSGMTDMVSLVKSGNIGPHVNGVWTDGDWIVMLQSSTPPLTATVGAALKAVGAIQAYP
jgi:hypothetical protein